MWIKQNLGYKLLALVASISLWFYVTGEQASPPSIPVPVDLEVRHLPQGLRVEQIPRRVMVAPPERSGDQINNEDLLAYVDLAGCRKGINEVDVQTIPVSATAKPGAVRVLLDTRTSTESKVLFVSPTLHGKIAPGYALSDVIVEPTEVTVFGSPTTLERTNLLRTEAVDISNASHDITQVIGYALPRGIDAQGSGHVKVTVRIQKL